MRRSPGMSINPPRPVITVALATDALPVSTSAIVGDSGPLPISLVVLACASKSMSSTR